ncbi:hypothetical protein [Cupriavidus sp. WS]|uniref:hypothetical protein n=1 Tax=Cupriavidus sp. WS TaxID=1312922 RepID=UPI0003747843|nr:hypothetical protein [Cupriavidus sp. WS]
MHLEYTLTPGLHAWSARPNEWIVIDDYGTKHDAIHRREPGAMFVDSLHKRWDLTDRQYEDPDYFRTKLSQPKHYYCREAMPFSSPIGLSIELDLHIDLAVHPAWDERAGDAYYERDRGARLEILCQCVHVVADFASTVTLAPAEVEEFCWQYIELERAREVAEQRAAQEAAR